MDASDRPRGRQMRWIGAALVAAALIGVLLAVLLGGGGRRRRTATTAATSTGATSTAPVVATPAVPGPAALPAPSSLTFGVNVNRLFNDRTYSSAAIDRHLSAVRADGITLARSDALWELAEPEPPAGGVHTYQWAFDDGVAGALAAHDLRWLPILDYSAYWDASVAGGSHSAPRSPDGFAAFARAVAARYGAGGEFWRSHPELSAQPVDTYEVWNEPDSPPFWAAPDPARYIDLYLRARDAIKQVDPQARVLIGGLTDPAFLAEALAARPDARGHIDGVGFHPYERTPLAVLGRVRDARRAMSGLGLGSVPLYITELGWATSPATSMKYAPPNLRPGYLTSAAEGLARADCGIAAVVVYTWVTPERDPGSEEDWFGIEHPDGTPSPSSRAYAGVVAQAPRLQSLPRVRLCGS